MDSFAGILFIVCLLSAYLAGFLRLRMQKATMPYPRVTMMVTLLIAIPTTLQFFFPSILQTLQRDAAQFVAGNGWRVITPLFVQDGGVGGSVFNLVSLLFVGNVAEQLWSTRRWLIIFFAGGILLVFKDIHGSAIAFGTVTALLFVWSDRRMLSEKR